MSPVKTISLEALLRVLLLTALAVFIASCESTVDPYTLDLTAMEYFQKAIEASDKENYALALKFYEAFQAKHPEDLPNYLWASYEIAFSYYKIGQLQKARELFEALLGRYEELENSDEIDQKTIPQGPKILAHKILEKITPENDDPKEAAGTN